MSNILLEALRSKQTYFLILCFLAASLPLSNVGMSIGTIALFVHISLRNDWKARWSKLIENKAALLIVGLYLLHIIGLIWTDDLNFAFNDIKNKLPLLIIVFSIGTSERLAPKEFNRIIQVYILACLGGTLTSMVVFLNLLGTSYEDIRDISLWISHIRFSLMIAFATLLCFISSLYTRSRVKQVALVGLAVWFIVFLILLKTMAGIVALGASMFILGIYNIARTGSSKVLRFLSGGLILVASFAVIFLLLQLQDFYSIKDQAPLSSDYSSRGGENYIFDYNAGLIENGYYVKWYIAPNELKEAWNKRSKVSYEGLDKKDQPIYMTILRYLTSKGLRKDREGVMALTQKDIDAIENGIANVRFLPPRSIDDRVYEIIWEIHNYRLGYNPEGNSIGMRFEYWKTGLDIWKDNFWLGVGTGDPKQEYASRYNNNEHNLKNKFRRRAHNQYLTMALTFGVFGLVYFIVCLFYPFLSEPTSKSVVFIVFFATYGLSMFTEDSLETQAGVTFFSFFWAILLFARPLDTPLTWNKRSSDK